MLATIRDFFESKLRPDPARDDPHTIELATAALLIEVVRSDAEIGAEERAAVLAAVRAKFGLGAAEADELIALAEQEVAQATDTFQFTSLVNREFTQPQKQRVIELMWSVAYADARLSAHEQHTIRRIAELLHVPHPDYINAKIRARAAAGLPPT